MLTRANRIGLALGLTSAIMVFVLGVMASLSGWGLPMVALLSTMYFGYSPSFVGSIAGAVWAFADGFIAGVLIAWLYNRFLLRRQHTLR